MDALYRARDTGLHPIERLYRGSPFPPHYSHPPLRPTYLSFGDVAHKTSDGSDAALTALPELRTEIITERDELVLLATDGLWDVMDSQNAINMVRKSLNKHHKVKDAVKELVKEAIKLGSVDNVSAVVVVFNQSKEGEAGAGAGARRK